MNALTMLRAMSRLDPQDIADAWDGAGAVPDAEAFLAEPEPRVRQVKHPMRRIAEWAAAAACIALGVTAVLKFRAFTDRPPLNSSQDQTADVTLVTTETTAALSGTTAQTTVSLTETQTETTDTVSDENLSQTSDTADTSLESGSTASETTEETTSAATERNPQKTPDPVPLLAAMGDKAGRLTKNGTDCSADECVWSIVKDKAAIEAYLTGDDPEVILGTGKKSADTAAEIREKPALIRIRWQSEDNRWESYGITSAAVENGVLKLGVSVYCADAEGGYARSPWIYEAGLLCAADTLPDLRDVQITVAKFTDTEETGIREWMRYNDSLDPDVYLTIK